jgi:hypothetical protein
LQIAHVDLDHVDRMDMRIDQTRQHESAAEVFDLGLRTGPSNRFA